MVDGIARGPGPRAMHVVNISFTTPHSNAVLGIDTESRWGIAFQLLSIDNQTFLLPIVARLEVTHNGAPDLPYPPIFGPGWEGPGDHKSLPGKRWIFSARYSNYRKLPTTPTTP